MRSPAVAAFQSVFLGLLLGAPSSAVAEELPEAVLVEYGFDEASPTGPDTVRVFQNASGHVRLSDAFRFSGFGSVELRDVAGDGDFPELQGYFPETREGRLYLQLALMVPDAGQELNIALAGPRGFRLGRDGIAFWLSTRDGWLFHTSDSIPKRLLELEPFAWYLLTVDYDVEAGRYDLWVTREGETEVAVTLLDQPNAASQGASAVHLFSFIGDNGDDLSSVVYYVDDVVVARSRPATMKPFVAPGRRSFFADLATDSPLELLKRCPEVHSLGELGIVEKGALAERDWEILASIFDGEAASGGSPALAAAEAWSKGCAELRQGRFKSAEEIFARGLERSPRASALGLGRAMALVVLGRFEELDRQLEDLSVLGDDARYLHLRALALARTSDPVAALEWLEAPALAALASKRPDAPADAYFALLRLEGRAGEAHDYALAMAEGQEPGSRPASLWFERAGQAAFTARDLVAARRAFESALDGSESEGPWLSLADVAWLEGDHEEERRLREKVFGRLAFDP